jgi:hypothetical protein
MDMARQGTQQILFAFLALSPGVIKSLAPTKDDVKEQTKGVLTKPVEVTDLKVPDNLPGLHGFDTGV